MSDPNDPSRPGARRRGPTLIEDGLAPASETPADAPDIDEPQAEAAAAAAVRVAASGGPSTLARIFWSALGGLFTMALGLWFWEIVEAFLARNVWLGWIALALAILVGLAALGVIVRELASLARLGRIDDARDAAVRARATRDRGAALAAIAGVERLYGGRAELAGLKADMSAKMDDVVDGDALVDLAERTLMTPLDKAAEAAVRRGARDAATATAIIPFALIDVLAILAINLKMIRRIAEIYGGRTGWLGSWRLLRAIAAHLVAAGAIAVGDDLLGPALGGGILARVSRRFGEGLVNGALTARIGVAAMEVCRPLPFAARPRPGVSALIRGAFGDVAAPRGEPG